MNESLKKPRVKWLVCGLLAAVTLAAYAPVAEHPFINLDDPDYVINNLPVRQGLTAQTVHWAFCSFHSSNWHPVTWLSHALDCQLFGLQPMGHHLVNVFFHTLNTVLLFLLLQNLTTRMWASAFVALLFGLHPMHVESVAWVAERKDVLSGFFFLLTLLCYARAVTSGRCQVASDQLQVAGKRPAWSLITGHGSLFYWLALLCFALGLMSKPMLVTVPGVLLLLDFWPLGRMQKAKWKMQNLKPLLLEKIPFGILSLASCWITLLAQAHAIRPAADFPLAARLAHMPVAYTWYLFKLIWPVDHSIYYLLHVGHVGAKVTGAVALLGLATIVFIRQARQHPGWIFGWLWFLVMLVPVAGFVQAGSQAYAERYTYLPAIGIFIILAWGVSECLAKQPWHRRVIGIAALVASVACFKLTADQVHVWKSAETLFKQAVDEDANNEVAWGLYGKQFNHSGNTDRAIECLRQATAINPFFYEAWNDLGRMLVIKGRYAEAGSAIEKALANSREPHPEIYNNLASLLIKTGKTREAITNLEYSLELRPDQAEIDTLLGKTYLTDHQLDRAREVFEKAIRLYPDNAEAEMGLAMIHGEAGHNAEAMAHYHRVIDIETNSASALNNLAWLLATSADPGLRNGEEAVRLALRACELTKYEQAFFIGTLAAAYAEAGRFTEAVKTAQKARSVALAQGQKEVAANNERLLKIYESGRAYHEEARPAP